MTLGRFARSFAAALLAAIALGACGDRDTRSAAAADPARTITTQIPSWRNPGDAPARGTYVASAGAVYLALVVQGERVFTYVCDGRRLSNWLTGTARHGRIRVGDDDSRVEASLDQDAVTGTLTLAGGRQRAFRARPAVRGRTGLFVGASGDPGATRRWIATEEGIRGLDEGPPG